MMRRKGDTLIEVMIAIGIFCLIAIGAVAIMNSTMSNVQSTLESSMARNEIDAQAEALRFIQSSYIAQRDLAVSNQQYKAVWDKIKSYANESKSSVTQFSATTCADLYNKNNAGNIYLQNAFIINTRNLYGDANGMVSADAVIKAKSGDSLFRESSIYPRLVFGADTNVLIDQNTQNGLTSIEGIWIVAVKDPGTTVLDEDTGKITKSSAYYDFYIRSCWQVNASDVAQSISTVIRLYDPDIEVVDYALTTYSLSYKDNPTDKNDLLEPDTISTDHSSVVFKIPKTIPGNNNGNEFIGWSADGTCNTVYSPGGSFTVTATEPQRFIYAVWACPYSYRYNANGGTGAPATTTKTLGKRKVSFQVSSEKPTRANYTFLGWADSPSATTAQYKAGSTGPTLSAPGKTSVTLYAIWNPNYVISYNANGGSWPPADTVCESDTSPKTCYITTEVPARSGYKFKGWSTSASSGVVSYGPGAAISMSVASPHKTLYAVWQEQNDKITVKLTFKGGDCDSYVSGVKSNGVSFIAYYGTKVQNDINGLTIASLDYDKRSGGTETFTINTTGGRNYYYYVRNYGGCPYVNSTATVTVSSANGDFATRTYTASNASGSGNTGCWSVFAYKDGRIVDRMTRVCNETNY